MPTTSHIIFLTGLSAFLFFYQSATRPLSSSHEARAAQNAQSILDHNDWLLPRLFDRRVELQKPPLYYWLVAIFGRLNGNHVTALCVRLPAALSALATVLFVYYLGYTRTRPLAGFLAATILATSLHFTWTARVGRIDMPLSLTIAFALGCFYLGTQGGETTLRQSWKWFFAGYASLGFGVLLKGPITIALVGVVVVGWLIASWWFGRRRLTTVCFPFFEAIQQCGLWWGLPIVLGITVPWFILANIHTQGELFRVFFWYHNFARGFGGAEELPSYPCWFYVVRLVIDLFPWSIALPFACWHYFRSSKADRLTLFGGIWFCTMFFSLSCLRFKRADYLLPAYPGFAIFLGCVGERLWQKATTSRKCLRWSFGGLLLFIVTGWWCYILAGTPTTESTRPTQPFAKRIREHTNGTVIFFQVEAHDLAFELGSPINTVMTWKNLDRWSKTKEPVFVVMSPENAAKLRNHNLKQKFQEVVCTAELTDEDHDRPLVLLRSVK